MKLAALIATLVIGSSSLALAQPNTANWGHGPVVVQPQQPEPCETPAPAPQPVASRPIWHGPARQTTVALTQPARLTSGQVISVGRAAGTFNTLELKAVRGASFVKVVRIHFSNGTYQNVALNQSLDQRNPTISIDLTGTNRTIKNIEMIGSGRARSSYQLLAV